MKIVSCWGRKIWFSVYIACSLEQETSMSVCVPPDIQVSVIPNIVRQYFKPICIMDPFNKKEWI